MIVFIPNIYAISYYDSVTIKTSFSEEIDLDKIEKIEIAYADQTNYTKYITLLKENNFESELESIPTGDIKVEYGIVNDDTIGYYNVSADVYDNFDNTIEIIVNVSLQNNQRNEELVDDVKKDLMESNNVNSFNNNTNNTNNSNDNDDVDISENNTNKTTTTSKKDLEKQEEIRKQEEKKAANRKKSNIIGIIMFSIIGITIFVAIIYATIKISKANK